MVKQKLNFGLIKITKFLPKQGHTKSNLLTDFLYNNVKGEIL